ncbi:Putative L-lactate dehydrogenase operon regulatory protein [Variovorax sp. PBS-H4]|uniref:FadR/GntR family transcriptional regulator n=1 Tax=Variovorax sp. PBS-H4 TaxID=434008 RepID=UPI001317C263|nr:FCD domain-containing protein [Variovorax sp. PBS-H4]VTU36522.1 Putative L-lactate dehydrogenase operon regulatory protein [Variovorax sp. PBS-H4]
MTPSKPGRRTAQPRVELQVAPVAPQRIFQEVAAQLRRIISEGKLKPGDKLPPERELAALYGVSRNTMREALRALELSGLIELRLGATGGAFVLEGSSNAVVNGMRDLYFLGAITPEHLTDARISISAAVIRMAVERITDDEIDGLEENVAAAARAHASGDFAARTAYHQAFHMLLAKATRNPILIAAMEGVMEITRQFVKAIGPQEWPTHTLPSRRRLLRHLRARDGEAAVAEMTSSLRKLHRGYLVMARGLKPGEPVSRRE